MVETIVVLLVEQVFSSHFGRRIIVEVPQIAVEFHFGRENNTNDNDCYYQSQEPWFLVERHVVET